eukprot:CAMPEP_0184454884 /NCGR_PEP_ID=MMETSP0740-20130409/21734_1 /TAXON_ID=385413 /ORGANISM="Thalassiosira miniscula, Strain CCMP1093" /LENGTH=41 /DNA_ID= /DNA_START= /DNA_END= /DNA_ORIENTATION=
MRFSRNLFHFLSEIGEAANKDAALVAQTGQGAVIVTFTIAK